MSSELVEMDRSGYELVSLMKLNGTVNFREYEDILNTFVLSIVENQSSDYHCLYQQDKDLNYHIEHQMCGNRF